MDYIKNYLLKVFNYGRTSSTVHYYSEVFLKNCIPKLNKLEWFNISIEYFSLLMNINLWVGCVGDNEPSKL